MFPSLSIPQFTRPSTPPRSPHVELPKTSSFPFLSKRSDMPPTATTTTTMGREGTTTPDLSYSPAFLLPQGSASRAAVEAPFHTGPTNPYSPALRRSSLSTLASNRNIRPTRRDVLTCGLTLLVAWFLFRSTESDIGPGGRRDGLGGYAGGYPTSSRLNSAHPDDPLAYAEDEPMFARPAVDRGGYISQQLGKLGTIVPGLGGWLGQKGTTQGHGQGDFGMETICEVGAGGTVKVHGYSDSVAKVSIPDPCIPA
jgi:hypothetical protein